MRIAIDAMGGDYAPAESIKGTLKVLLCIPRELILIGKWYFCNLICQALRLLNRFSFQRGL